MCVECLYIVLDVTAHLFNVPEDDYGYLYEDVTNTSDNSVPYCPVERPLLNDTPGKGRLEGTCVICLDSKANQILIPCGHMCLCAACTNALTTDADTNNTCPLCQQKTQNIIRVITS